MTEMAVDPPRTLTWMDTRYSFQPVAAETLCPINDSAGEFLFNLGRKISLQSDGEAVAFCFSKSLS